MAHPLRRRAWDAASLLSSALFIALTVFGCGRFNESLSRGQEEEKSYTRHAMEYHRAHPDDQRQGAAILETWSKADYVAQAVEKRSKPGTSAWFSDQLAFLPDSLKRDNGKSFCVIQFPTMIVVLWPPSKPLDRCTIYLAPSPHDLSDIQSGDMDSSGRASESWVYVLKRSQQ